MQTSQALTQWFSNKQRRSWIVASLLFAALLIMLLRHSDPTMHTTVAMVCLLVAVLVAWLAGDLYEARTKDQGPGIASAVAHDLEATGVSAFCAPVCLLPPPTTTASKPPVIVPLQPRVATRIPKHPEDIERIDLHTLAPLPLSDDAGRHQD